MTALVGGIEAEYERTVMEAGLQAKSEPETCTI
jgi:hypothetical protein